MIMKKIILLLSVFFLSSCSLFFNASKNNNVNNKKYTPKKSIRIANDNYNSIEYIQAKAKVSLRNNNKMKSSIISFRLASDEKIWISASLGAARVLIDKDSVKYFNRIEKKYFVSDYNYLNSLIGFDTDFNILQNLLLGILIHKFDPSSLTLKSEDRYVFNEDQFRLKSKIINSTVSISPYNFRILSHSFLHKDNLFEVFYDDYTLIDEQILPTKIRFTNNGKDNLLIEIKSISSVEKINTPFNIPKNFKAINL